MNWKEERRLHSWYPPLVVVSPEVLVGWNKIKSNSRCDRNGVQQAAALCNMVHDCIMLMVCCYCKIITIIWESMNEMSSVQFEKGKCHFLKSHTMGTYSTSCTKTLVQMTKIHANTHPHHKRWNEIQFWYTYKNQSVSHFISTPM